VHVSAKSVFDPHVGTAATAVRAGKGRQRAKGLLASCVEAEPLQLQHGERALAEQKQV
jgi:hypothetical protein